MIPNGWVIAAHTSEGTIRKVRISYKRINDRTFSSKVTKVIKKKDADRFSISNLSFLCPKRMENKAWTLLQDPLLDQIAYNASKMQFINYNLEIIHQYNLVY